MGLAGSMEEKISNPRSAQIGSCTVKILSRDGTLATVIVPPWDSMIALEIDSPSPTLPAALERTRSSGSFGVLENYWDGGVPQLKSLTLRAGVSRDSPRCMPRSLR